MKQKRISTSDAVYEKIKAKIIELDYEPNLHLVEENLSNEFGISRTPLRQALYRLELEGLLLKKTTGRIYVAPISIQEAEEIYLIREVIEGLIARQATSNLIDHENRDDLLSRLEDVTFLMRKSAENDRYVDVVRYGSDFHQLLQTYSNNHTASNMLEQINNRLSRYRRLGVYKDPTFLSLQPVIEHEAILKAVTNRDVDGAEEAMRIHIRRSYKSTLTALSYLS